MAGDGRGGYIGAHVVRAFTQVGLEPVVLDDLSSGHEEFVPQGVPFVRGSVDDADVVADTLARHGIEGVVHLAGFKYAGVSVERPPLHTYRQNVAGTLTLLETMAEQGVDKIVYSSSAAVFGTPPDTELVTEQTPTLPESPPYGESKLVGECCCATKGVRWASSTPAFGTSTSSAPAPPPTSTTRARTTCSRWSSRP